MPTHIITFVGGKQEEVHDSQIDFERRVVSVTKTRDGIFVEVFVAPFDNILKIVRV